MQIVSVKYQFDMSGVGSGVGRLVVEDSGRYLHRLVVGILST